MDTSETKTEYSVGDELAVSGGWGGGWQILKIEKITPSGRIKCGRYELNPNLTIRGKCDRWGPFRAEPVTDTIREEMLRNKHLADIRSVKWEKLSTKQLSEVVRVCKLKGIEE